MFITQEQKVKKYGKEKTKKLATAGITVVCDLVLLGENEQEVKEAIKNISKFCQRRDSFVYCECCFLLIEIDRNEKLHFHIGNMYPSEQCKNQILSD